MVKRKQDELERAIEHALALGAFIGHRDRSDFFENIEAMKAKIAPLIRKDGEAARAVALLEMFIAGCYEKSEEIDDPGGGLGQFVGELFCDWIRARQAAKADPDETAGMLLSWMENDDYGYCQDLAKEAVVVLDRAGLRAFEWAVREKASGSEKESYAHRHKVEILKAIQVKRGDVGAYAALCEAEGDMAPADCEALAEMCLKRRMAEDALAWVERGLELEKKAQWSTRSSWRLPDLKREILKKLGRSGDALASAWEDYCRAPSVYSYEDLMKFVPKSQRAEWHAKALAAIDAVDLSSRIDLLVKTREWELLARTIEPVSREELVALSHYTTEPAAKGLVKSHPHLAAKLNIAMALRILEAKKSKYYDAALANLEQARKILFKEGQADEWEALAVEIRTNHRRKTGFIPGFERLAEGRLTREPSFAERTRKRWDKGAGGGES